MVKATVRVMARAKSRVTAKDNVRAMARVRY